MLTIPNAGLACQRGAKRRKMQAFLTLALLLARATPAARTLQRFMVNVLLRTPVLGLESHPDRVVLPMTIIREFLQWLVSAPANERARRRAHSRALFSVPI